MKSMPPPCLVDEGMRMLLLAVGLLGSRRLLGHPPSRIQFAGRAERRERMLNLRKVADAVRAYRAAYGHYPMSDRAAGGETAMSWRVQILPFLDDPELDAAGMPKVFALPGQAGTPGQTYYQVLVGPDTMFPPALPGLTEAEVEKKVGAANAIMIVEAAQPARPGAPPRPDLRRSQLACLSPRRLLRRLSGWPRRVHPARLFPRRPPCHDRHQQAAPHQWRTGLRNELTPPTSFDRPCHASSALLGFSVGQPRTGR